ncbi:MAG: Fic family protein [Brumimicrobium sp.]
MSNQEKVLEVVKNYPLLSSSEIHEKHGLDISFATTKRLLAKLVLENLIESEGKGKGTKYKVSIASQIIKKVDLEEYYKQEIDERTIKRQFDFELINDVLRTVNLFNEEELKKLNSLQNQFSLKSQELSQFEFEKEMERLAIDLSWKSSEIEGNTYSLLETERLLKEKITAEGKTKDEATMLLNHKDALDFILQNPDYLKELTVAKIENIHSVLVKDLQIDRNIRKRRVGISGTNFKPIDNEFQIKEALQSMCDLVNAKSSVFEKSLFIIVLISYIQPFNDGNKRTARIVSNAILIDKNFCPISFRTVDSIEYKKALLLFYEQNNISAFKEIFIEQFEFAVDTYF